MAKLKTGRHTSAIKAWRQSERRASHNRGITKRIRTSAKDLLAAIGKKDAETVKTILPKVSSQWDKAARKGVIHWKAAARKKSRLAKRAKAVLAAPAK